MQELPLLPQSPDPSLRRGQRQRHHHRERDHPHGDERTFRNVGEDELQRKSLVDEVGGEVQRRVEKCEEPEHPPVLHHAVPAGEPPQRGDREGEDQHPDRPDAGRQREVLDRVHAQPSGQGPKQQPGERQQRGDEHCRLGELLHAVQ